MRLLRQPVHKCRPLFNSVVGNPLQADMRSRTQEPLLQILTKAVVDSQRHDQRRHARSNSDHGNAGDDADKRLPPFGAQIAGRNKKFEAHGERSAPSASASG